MKKIALVFAFTILSCTVFAQLEKPITWSYFAKRVNKTEAVLYLKAKLDGKWHVYSQNVKSEAMKLKFNYAYSKDFTLIGKTIEPKPIKKYDKTVKMDLAYFEKEVVFQQKIKMNKTATVVKAKIEFMVCNDRSCLPADEITLTIPVK
ncbi:sugar transporter [Pedobacter sp. LMG 31464]|uniref:Sugar transporter n=1 Tax=Pedobacter planticolens TaxID=2679964 RepID=A0A923IVR0_9SPHI|nr:protein-disulfide reductase DsbD domain-containing protein [Pedobacter planticolens]MBB2146296.1 sugar transporter [Pedobacter planticolens]